MLNLFLDITTSTVDWSRAQFALTAIYHWLFVPLTLGLSLIMAITETRYYLTKEVFWKDITVFWQKLFGINFAMGIATGIILEFEFGTNWSNYSWMVGDVFGAPLAIEGVLAFFMESTFVAVMFFGWNKVSKGFHLASTWLTSLGATLSAWWILVANSWMQYPVGQTFNPDTMRFEMTSFLEVAFSPVAIEKLGHTITSSWMVGVVFCIGVSSWYLLKKRETRLAISSIKVSAAVGIFATLIVFFTGDKSGSMIAQVQPMKLAAMEALYDGGKGLPLTIISPLNPFKQPDYTNEKPSPYKLYMPKMLSLLATSDLNGYVPGVNDLINGYVKENGDKEPSYAEKIERGKKAIVALKTYRDAVKGKNLKKEEMPKEAKAQLPIIKQNIDYMGYGFIKNVDELVPNIPITFYAFRVMVGIGTLLLLFFFVVLYFVYKPNIIKHRWLLYSGIAMIPLVYIASEAGWIVAELGRQPWTIQDMLPVGVAVSNIPSSSIALTFYIFLFLFTAMLIVEINIMLKQIKKGPEYTIEKVENSDLQNNETNQIKNS